MLFEHLPETFPEPAKRKKPALFGSAALHILAILLLLIIPLWVPYDTIRPEFVTRLYLPPPPAAPAASPAARVHTQTAPAIHRRSADVEPPAQQPVKTERPLIAPTTIPTDIAAIADLQPTPPEGATGGVSGAVPEGILGGVPGFSSALHVAPQPPPPRPPRPPAPDITYTVGGDVKEPRLVKYVAPEYPLIAKSAKITGTIVLKATVTKAGTVADVQLVSGNPLLVGAAIKAVRQWRYQPTRLNGIPISVVLTAKIAFSLARIS